MKKFKNILFLLYICILLLLFCINSIIGGVFLIIKFTHLPIEIAIALYIIIFIFSVPIVTLLDNKEK